MVPKTQDGGIDGAKNLRWWYRWWYRWCYRWCLRKVRWWYRWCYRWCLRFWLLVVRSIGTIYTTIYRVLAPSPPWRRTQRYLAGLSCLCKALRSFRETFSRRKIGSRKFREKRFREKLSTKITQRRGGGQQLVAGS